MHPRDHSRLLVMGRKNGSLHHRHFFDLPEFLQKGDVLVFNNSKVFPARLIGAKPTGGKIEVFLLRSVRSGLWEVLIGGKVKKIGLPIYFAKGLIGEIVSQRKDTWHIRFNKSGKALDHIIAAIGKTPTPPYIKKHSKLTDYQTIYADDEKVGSVAAPTAGFHFTKSLMHTLKQQGIQTEFVTLHVGLGTFAPVKTARIEDHNMHPEFVEINDDTMKRLRQAKKERRRIIAVGTTSVRVLESVWEKRKGYRGFINCFIYPGYHFKATDAMITNFHLPKSTLLMLVSAFAGRVNILRAYQNAIRKKYRFYSFGDAMFIQ